MWSSRTELKGEMRNIQVSYERLSPRRAFFCYSGLWARAPTNEIALLIVWVQISSSSCTSLPLGSQLSLPMLPHGNFSLVCSLLPQPGLQSAPQKLCFMCLNKAPWQENKQELGSQPCCLSQLLQRLLPSGQDSFQPPAPWKGPKPAPNL